MSHYRLLTNVPRHEDLVNELSADNCTALYYACCVGNQEVSKILLEKGGKKTINEQDYENGQTALHMAIMSGDLWVFPSNNFQEVPFGHKFSNKFDMIFDFDFFYCYLHWCDYNISTSLFY